eukprot:4704266-Pleurochrysis_carterae.AAC.1
MRPLVRVRADACGRARACMEARVRAQRRACAGVRAAEQPVCMHARPLPRTLNRAPIRGCRAYSRACACLLAAWRERASAERAPTL